MNIKELNNFIGLGIAGNFAYHLEQAGEDKDFVDIQTKEANEPKGIFPFYIPKTDSFLGVFPLSSKQINLPTIDKELNLQMEPEMALIAQIVYNENMQVKDLKFSHFTAYNDCSIRKEGAKKISEKKNWGIESKGISDQIITLDKFKKGGTLDSYHLASFLKRDGVVYPYGEDSAVINYNYFYDKLKNWIIDKLNTQKDFGPLEDMSMILKEANYPQNLLISIGATSYTTFGKENFLQKQDELYIYLYDSNFYSKNDIFYLAKNGITQIPHSSTLHQSIV